MKHKTLNIKGELVSMEITPKMTKSGLDVIGWSLHAVSNRGLQLHSFISGCDEGQVWIEAKALVRLRLKIIEQKKKSDLLFERIQDLDLEDKKDCFCYFFGAMQDRIEDDDIALLDKWIEEKKKYRAEELERQHEIIDAAEELPDLEFEKILGNALKLAEADDLEESDITKDIPTEDLPDADFKGKTAAEVFDDSKFENNEADEEVDASDCCHSEDVKSVQPPLRSSVQDSPDDPYYVCGSCEQKCEIETWKRSELEDERSYESGE